ncbi:copper chaperone PCu(A)C [Streptomyces cucumeris]|uniref:copper chaperone PCu(A)C n=1 Tax=Streptomyces cucumeris TaxID=2962890 RepID=UPI003D7101F3
MPSPWRPTRRRLTDAACTVLVLAAVAVLAMSALTVWVKSGKAGSPARITVKSGRVFLPYDAGAETAVLFDIANPGGADDRLLKVASPAVRGQITLRRPPQDRAGGASDIRMASAAVPAGRGLAMSPGGVLVALKSGVGWRVGDLVPFTLYFERSGAVRAVAVVR